MFIAYIKYRGCSAIKGTFKESVSGCVMMVRPNTIPEPKNFTKVKFSKGGNYHVRISKRDYLKYSVTGNMLIK